MLTTACFWDFCVAGSRADSHYSIKDRTPDGYVSSTAYDIMARGDVVGIAQKWIDGLSVNDYFIYDHSEGTSTVFGTGAVTPQGSIVGTEFRMAAINNDGHIAGTAVLFGGSSHRHGFIYSSVATEIFKDLRTYPLGTGI